MKECRWLDRCTSESCESPYAWEFDSWGHVILGNGEINCNINNTVLFEKNWFSPLALETVNNFNCGHWSEWRIVCYAFFRYGELSVTHLSVWGIVCYAFVGVRNCLLCICRREELSVMHLSAWGTVCCAFVGVPQLSVIHLSVWGIVSVTNSLCGHLSFEQLSCRA